MPTVRKLRLEFWLPLIALGALGAAAVLWLTPRGPGIDPDSIVYLQAAQSLMTGKGYVVDGALVTHFPPLYPLLLGAAGPLLGSLPQAARFLDAVFYAINLLLIGIGAYLASGRRSWAALLTALFALTSEPLLEVHAWMMSEPPFLTLFLVGVLLLAGNLVRPRAAFLAGSALALGLASVTRYLGLGLPPVGALLLLLLGPDRDRMRRRLDAASWLAISALPPALLFLYNGLTTGSIADRVFAFHPQPVGPFVMAVIGAFSTTLSLDPLVSRLGAAGLVLLGVYMMFFVIKGGQRLSESGRRSLEFAMPVTCLALSAGFLLGLFASLAFFDASTAVNERILSPVIVLGIMAGIPALLTLTTALKDHLAWWAALLLIVSVMIARAPAGYSLASSRRTSGLGFNSPLWLDSALLRYADSIPTDVPIYSNGWDLIRYADQRPAIRLPRLASPTSLQPNLNLAADLAGMCADIQERGAYILYFDDINWRWYFPGEAELRAACPLTVRTRLNDGLVFSAP